VVGAVVAVVPNALAGEVVRIGEFTDVADNVPGTVNPPCKRIAVCTTLLASSAD
jgi:hypothetical protein